MARGQKVRMKVHAARKPKGAPPDLEKLLSGIMDGSKVGREGAERYGFDTLRELVTVFMMGEGGFPDALRAFVRAFLNPNDALRKDLPPEVGAMLFPALNTLLRGRMEFEKMMAKKATETAAAPETQLTPHGATDGGRKEEGGEEGGEHVGVGVLRDGPEAPVLEDRREGGGEESR